MSKNKGLLIAFEGIDGTGKSTQLELLASYLSQQGHVIVKTREPTNGPYGQKIRQLYVNRQQATLEEELQLFIKDRRQHVEEVIKPAIGAGKIVLTDRYYFSTAAYQGAAGLDPVRVFKENSFAPEPDMVLLLTMDPCVSIDRICNLRGDTLNDFEQEEQLHKVANLFASFAHPCLKRIIADTHLETVQQEIRLAVSALLDRV